MDARTLREVIAADLADSCRTLGLRAAARLSTPQATRLVWADIASELSVVQRCELREHERAAAKQAAEAMSHGDTARAACALATLRGQTVEAWAADVADEMVRRSYAGTWEAA